MRKHPPTTRHYTPGVDPLEGRSLLSALGVSSEAPAAVAVSLHKTTSHPVVSHSSVESDLYERDDHGFDDTDEVSIQAASKGRSERVPAPAAVGRSDQDFHSSRILPFGDPVTSVLTAAHPFDGWQPSGFGHGRPQSSPAQEELAPNSSSPDPALPGRERATDLLRPARRLAEPASRKPAADQDPEPSPAPRGLGMISEVLPFAGDSLERAVDRICAGIDDLGGRPPDGQSTPASIVPPLALATLAATMEIGRRQASRARAGRPIACLRVPGFGVGGRRLPGIPGTH